jgi:lipopolysaccharide transport system ATP-binding protein
MYGTNTWHTEQILTDLKEGDGVEYAVRFPMNLGPGSYSVSTVLSSADTHLVDNYEWRDLAFILNVSNMDKKLFVGCNWIEPDIQIVMRGRMTASHARV